MISLIQLRKLFIELVPRRPPGLACVIFFSVKSDDCWRGNGRSLRIEQIPIQTLCFTKFAMAVAGINELQVF